jgi:hypothetical protein
MAVLITLSITLFIKIVQMLSFLLALALPAAAFDARSFEKIQLHAHTSESDGDTSPAAVARAYKKLGFGALAVTDHDKLTRLEKAPLTLLPGVEITSRGGDKPVHVNALCATSVLKRAKLPTPREALADAVKRAREDGALALVNHPNWTGALATEDLLAVEGFEMLEIASGHPLVEDDGGPGVPSAETHWQRLLDQGRKVLAVAADDAHDYAAFGEGRRPGQAWVEAWDVDGSSASYCAALRAGSFYASTGARLARLSWDGRTLLIEAAHFPPGSSIEFFGEKGKRLGRAETPSASYQLGPNRRFVRARVTLSDGKRAWTQAYPR